MPASSHTTAIEKGRNATLSALTEILLDYT